MLNDENLNHSGEDEGEELSSGARALAGFEYQVDVSVWTALALVLDMNLADSITVEPCSQEDIEANLKAPNSGLPMGSLSLQGSTLNIQVKSRSLSAWTCNDVVALLKHGGKNRTSAAERLKDSKIQYLLITNAEVTGEAHKLRVREFGQWPKAAKTPKSIANVLPSDGPGRVAIMSFVDTRDIREKVRNLLLFSFNIPTANWEACYERLRSRARAKMAGQLRQEWTREDLVAIVVASEGSVASNPDLEGYVHPSNWSTLTARLQERHAVVISGKSGTGKTKTSTALWEDLRLKIPGIARVVVRHISDIRDTSPSNPVLFDIEDPWGKFKFDYDTNSLALEIPDLLESARPHRKFLVTSRDDVLEQANATDSIENWAVALQPEDYTRDARKRLYQNQISQLPKALQILAQDHQDLPLRVLETPLEISKFFVALRASIQDSPLSELQRIEFAISQAHKNSIEDLIWNQIRSRNEVHLATAMWGLFKVYNSLPRAVIPQFAQALAEKDSRFDQGLSDLFSFLVAGRSLRQNNAALTYYHPRVEAGLQRIVQSDPIRSRRTLSFLSDAALEISRDHSQQSALSDIANLCNACVTIPELNFKIPSLTQAALDPWLEEKLLSGGPNFSDVLTLIRRLGSAEYPPANMARLIFNYQLTDFWNDEDYERLELTEQQLSNISAHPSAKAIFEIFIREVMPGRHFDFIDGLSVELTKLVDGLGPAFADATLKIVTHGYHSNCKELLNGALTDIEGFEHVAEAALRYWNDPDANKTDYKAVRLEVENGEHDDEYGQHLLENDDFYSAGEILEAYTYELRKQLGWRALISTNKAKDLLQWWLQAAERTANDCPLHHLELSELLCLSYETKDEPGLWAVLTSSWWPAALPVLYDRVTVGHANLAVRENAISCLAMHAEHILESLVNELAHDGNYSRIVGIFDELTRASDTQTNKGRTLKNVATKWRKELPAEIAELVQPLEVDRHERTWPLSAAALRLAQTLRPSNSEERAIKIEIGRAHGFDVSNDIRTFLAETDDHEQAVIAFKAAITAGYNQLVDEGLTHKFARVRALALKEIAGRNSDRLSPDILSAASDAGRYVRQALVEVLAEHASPVYMPTLLVLIKDTWSSDPVRNGTDNKYPIARGAAKILSQMSEISDSHLPELLEYAGTVSDSEVRCQLFDSLTDLGSIAAREAVLDVALTSSNKQERLAAGRALFRSKNGVEEHLITQLTPALICEVPEESAAQFSLIVGSYSTRTSILELAVQLANNLDRQVLLVLLGIVATKRFPDLCGNFLNFLPADHPSRMFICSEPTSLLPRDCFDDIGNARSVKVTLEYLGEYFEPQPKPVVPRRKKRKPTSNIPTIE